MSFTPPSPPLSPQESSVSNTGEYGCHVFFVYDQSIYGDAASGLRCFGFKA